MADMTVPKNDKGYYLSWTVKDSAGDAYNLTDYTIKLKVWSAGRPGTLIVDGTCNIVVAASGTCRYLVTATDFTLKGTHSAELELTKTDVAESTRMFTIEVTESG
jgi:hypothetical protein